MPSNQSYPIRNDTLGQHLLTLRSRAKLTQAEFAARIGVHRRSVQKWESGETYPTAEHLRTLIALLLDLAALLPGQERAEATDLWQRVRAGAPPSFPPFDTLWFEEVLAARPGAPFAAHPSAAPRPPGTTTLPIPSTSLIGRANELAEIATLLADPACRLLTLFGPGGIGKTRLAVAVAAEQAPHFRQGVVLVDLSAVTTAPGMVSAIGDALRLTFTESEPTSQLLRFLHEQQLLLVLDDFEHLLEATALVSAILDSAPGLTLLVTSRTRLNLQAEWLFDVEGLTYPTEEAQAWTTAASPATLADYSAVQLFIQRAKQVHPRLALSQATLVSIGRICQSVAGIPLAIELAAAAVRTLSLGELERQLRSNLDLLATSLRDVPPRHRSMRAVFDHSWALLSELEATVLSRLAIFRGGWDQRAAEAICARIRQQLPDPDQLTQALPFEPYTFSPAVLASLVDKSLVRRQSSMSQVVGEGEAGTATPRFVLLEPIRDYALEKLTARGEAPLLRHAHAHYYLSVAESAAAQWSSSTAPAIIEQLDRERDNLRAALQWACDSSHSTLGLDLARALLQFWRRRGALSEGRMWLEKLLALSADLPEAAANQMRLRAMHSELGGSEDRTDLSPPVPTPPTQPVRVDWGLAQQVPVLYGRSDELALLTQWALTDQCRLITLVGLGGIGKTSLAITVAQQIAPHFAVVIFRSLGEAPPLPMLLDQLIDGVATQPVTLPLQLADKVALLIELLRQRRSLVILDHWETLLQAGTTSTQYQAGYEGYALFLKMLGETAHQSCLLLTSRERPQELAALEGPRNVVRSLVLTGLPEAACQLLLADQELRGTPATANQLARHYGGNPLALKLVAEPIRDLFNGDMAAFLTEGNLFFGAMGQLLADQINRTSPLEQILLTWLAIGREPMLLDDLWAALKGGPGGRWGRSTVLAALYALWRRNLIELGQLHLNFTLQRAVLEFLTAQLIERVAHELLHGTFDYLARYALIQATAKEEVRHSQERLLGAPLLARLAAADDSPAAAEQRLLALLERWQGGASAQTAGYVTENLTNLLRVLRGNV